jgi:hypothetical protein
MLTFSFSALQNDANATPCFLRQVNIFPAR